MALFCFRTFLLILTWLAWSCNGVKTKTAELKAGDDLSLAEQLKNRGKSDSAIGYYENSIQYHYKNKQFDQWGKSISGIVDCYRSKGEIDKALDYVNNALLQTPEILDTSSVLYNTLIHKKALLLSDKRLFAESSALFERNIKYYLRQSVATDTLLALSYNGMGTVYYLQRAYPEALAQYDKALIVYKEAGKTESLNYANTLQNIGIVNSMSGNYEKAEQFFLNSLKINQKILSPDNPKLASLYINMGRFYQLVRNDSKAINYMDQAESFYISQNQTNSLTAASLFLNMGVVSIYTADYEKAQSYLNKSLEIISVKAPGNRDDLQSIYLNMGHISEKKGELDTAKDYYLKGLQMGENLGNTVKILRALANLEAKLSDFQSSDIYYRKALEKGIEMQGDKHTETALTYLRYGDFLSSTGNNKALGYLEKSLELYQSTLGEVNIDVATAYYYIGLYYFRKSDYRDAVAYFQKSLVAGFPKFTSTAFNDNPAVGPTNLSANSLNTLVAKSLSLYLLYKSEPANINYLKSSADTYMLAVKMIESLRSSYQDEDSKIFITGNEKSTFTKALQAHIELYSRTGDKSILEKAFIISEKGKSSVLLAHLRNKEAQEIGRLPKELLKEDANLKSEIYSYNKLIHDQSKLLVKDEEKIKKWNSKLFDLRRKQDELIKKIEKDYPTFYNLKYDNSVVSVTEIQKNLSPDQAILEYTITDSILYSFAITCNEIKLVNTVIDSTFFGTLQQLRNQLTGRQFNNYSKSDFRIFTTSAHAMYQTLIKPVMPLANKKELIIIPDGELGYLSFDVLLSSLPDTSKQSYRRLPYLIKETAITYAPSATTFYDERNKPNTKNNNRILAFGPDYGKENQVLEQTDFQGKQMRKTLANLQNSQDEIKQLGNYFYMKAFTGNKATETAFKQYAPQYRVLHLAMHAVINNENPLYSKLIFFKSPGDTIEDGMLNASELVNMELNAEMAVLSACNTGSGKMQKGEGIMSLSRDFFYAGVPGIVMTVWAVEDRAGIKLMDNFYKHIAEGNPRHKALQNAKTEYLENCDNLTAHPHYWASYLNVGDISPLNDFRKKPVSISVNGTIATILAFFILASAVFLHRKRLAKARTKS